MIKEYLSKITEEERAKNSDDLYIRSLLKEYLQILLLHFIYTHTDYKKEFVFTGGTCLRHIYDLPRLSESLDFDLLVEIGVDKFADQISSYFLSDLQYKDFSVSIKQQGNQVLLKFPFLRELGLATEQESDLLYVKFDLSQIPGESYELIKTTKSQFGYNFVALHYDLASLFAGKIHAILTRNLLKGRKNRQTIKGRDFFDLLWYLRRETKVNISLLRERLNKKDLTLEKLKNMLDKKVQLAAGRFKTDFKNDLIPFVRGNEFVNDYVDNYLEEYQRYDLKVST